jgi:hypothetical protein
MIDRADLCVATDFHPSVCQQAGAAAVLRGTGTVRDRPEHEAMTPDTCHLTPDT